MTDLIEPERQPVTVDFVPEDIAEEKPAPKKPNETWMWVAAAFGVLVIVESLAFGFSGDFYSSAKKALPSIEWSKPAPDPVKAVMPERIVTIKATMLEKIAEYQRSVRASVIVAQGPDSLERTATLQKGIEFRKTLMVEIKAMASGLNDKDITPGMKRFLTIDAS